MEQFEYENDPIYLKLVDNKEEKFTFFWAGEFSQWHKSPFEISYIKYPTAEHYMMYMKAILMGDTRTATKVLETKSPRDVKELGRKITPFDPVKWNMHKVNVVLDGTRAKFKQNEHLEEILFATQGTTLVEASPVDPIWGIALDENDPLAQDRSTWKGLNLLGRVLTQVRYELNDNKY